MVSDASEPLPRRGWRIWGNVCKNCGTADNLGWCGRGALKRRRKRRGGEGRGEEERRGGEGERKSEEEERAQPWAGAAPPHSLPARPGRGRGPSSPTRGGSGGAHTLHWTQRHSHYERSGSHGCMVTDTCRYRALNWLRQVPPTPGLAEWLSESRVPGRGSCHSFDCGSGEVKGG